MSLEREPYILVYGVSVYDIIGFAYENYKKQDSNPGNVKVSYGGVCRNIAENLVRIGANIKFISIVGDDEKGHSILNHAKSLGLDMENSLIVKGGSTPTYMAILNESGEMQAAIVDMKLMDCLDNHFLDEKEEFFENAEYTIVGTDRPDMIEYLLKKHEGRTKFILDPVSSKKVEKLKHMLSYFDTIKPNRVEAECLCGFLLDSTENIRKAGSYFLSLGIKNVIISLDEEGVYYTNGTEEGIIKASVKKVVNVTGAGDSCVAGIAYGFQKKMSLRETVRYAIAMSVITIEHEETIHPKLDYGMVMDYIQKLAWSEHELKKM